MTTAHLMPYQHDETWENPFVFIHQVVANEPIHEVDCGWGGLNPDSPPQLIGVGYSQESAEFAVRLHGDWFATADELCVGFENDDNGYQRAMVTFLAAVGRALNQSRQIVIVEQDSLALALSLAFAIYLQLNDDIALALQHLSWLSPNQPVCVDLDIVLLAMNLLTRDANSTSAQLPALEIVREQRNIKFEQRDDISVDGR